MDIPRPPDDLELRNIIDKLAQFVARNGQEFEEMTKNKQSGNPKFLFLFGGEFHRYYRFRVATEQSLLDNEMMKHSQMPMPMPHTPQPPIQPMMNTFYSQMPPFPPVSQPQQQFMQANINSNNNYSQPASMHLASQAPLPPPSHQLHSDESFHHHNNHFASQNVISTNFSGPMPPGNFNNNWHTNNSQSLDHNNEIDSQINQYQAHIKESEKNLASQHDVLMVQEKKQRIEEMITKMHDDELKRMCEDFNINLNEFDKILQPIIESCRKESIKNGKIWIFNNCHINEHYDAVAKHLLKRVSQMNAKFEAKLHIMYLINDIFNHCMRKNDEKLKTAIIKIIVPAFSTVIMESTEEKKQKMTKLLKIWETNQYLDQTLLDKLKKPEQSLDAYKTSLYTKFDEQIQAINDEQMNKYNQMQKLHTDMVANHNAKIQQLQQQKQQQQHSLAPVAGNMLRSSFSNMANPNSNMFSPMAGQVNAALPPLPPMNSHQMPGNPPPFNPQQANFVHNPIVPTNCAPPPTPQQPIHMTLAQGSSFAGPFPNQHAPNSPGNFFPNSNNTPMFPPNTNIPSQPNMILPMPNISPISTSASMPSQTFPMVPHPEETKPAPYFDMPAGIMTQYVKLEDFDYNSIDPSELKMPALLPPSERLLQALEAFYTPPSHEHPRNAEGWEKLGLYEFFKAKSQARKEYETKLYGQEQSRDSEILYDSDSTSLPAEKCSENSLNNKKTLSSENSKQNSTPKRVFKEFKETKSRSRSRSRSVEKRNYKNLKSRSRSRSSSRSSLRSRSSSWSRSPQNRRKKSPKYSRRRRSKSRSSSSPECFKSNKNKRDTYDNNKNKSKMWSNNSITKNESQTTQSFENYQGFGINSTYNTNTDPFESFRRNKGKAYLQRIRDGKRD